MAKHSTEGGEVSGKVVGLDLGDEYSSYAVIDMEDGVVEAEGRVATRRPELKGLLGSMDSAVVVIEAGSSSAWVERLLRDLGHRVIVANPRKVALIARSQRKNDRMDALTLARLARYDPGMLHPIQHRGLEGQKVLASLRLRDFLVRSRTQMLNHARGLSKGFGEFLPKCSSEAFPRRVAETELPEWLMAMLKPLMEQVEALTAQIEELDAQIEAVSERDYPETGLLRQVKGVGPITSLAYVLTLEDASRFKRSRDVGAYLGLTPGQRQSGNRDPQLHITKAGDQLLRRLLVQCGHYILGRFGADSDLREWGLRLAGQPAPGQKGSKRAHKRAVTAVARKLAVLLHRLWVSGKKYEPRRRMKGEAIVAV